ncbi:MAG: acyl-CoA dehydrogenase [Bacteroidetes bacterium]|nr:MAG: acyl-CoA dehydrogenase [Bacteroidota bacterium]
MEPVVKQQALKGGEFLIRETDAREVFIPEDFNEEQRMMAQACQDFINTEINPVIERIEHMEPGLLPSLMEKAGELGLLGITVPEEYGGLGMSFNTSMLIADIFGQTGSFSTAFGAHTGIGTLPIQYYGNEEQKEKYLPLLGSGQWKACYCLTEPDAGSDANSGKTRAVLSADGSHYLITGQKMWISNAGFADLLIVFAKIDNDKNLSAFIVEKTFGGITMGEEEKKLGIKGSSTRQVFFNETPVPVENMLSERGNGFKIAVNILNIGRIKLAAGVIGGCKDVLSKSVVYANERRQFGQSISGFGAIKHKMAEMATRLWVTEAAAYRAGQNIEQKIEELKASGLSKEEAILKGVEQFAIECAIMKVHGSEVLDYIVDEGVQIYGGMGFSADAPMERAYRDARITRIYEGTNEINRMLLVGMIFKRAMKGELNLLGPAMAVAKELTSMPEFGEDTPGILAEEKKVLKNLKKALLMVAGKAAQDIGARLDDEQEVLMLIADMVIEIYAAESALLRAEKMALTAGEDAAKSQLSMAKIYLAGAVERVQTAGREAIAAFATDDEANVLQMGLKRFTKTPLVNTVALRRQIADVLIAENGYKL